MAAVEDHEHDHRRCERAAVLDAVADALEREAAEGLEGLPRLRSKLRTIAQGKRAEAAALRAPKATT